MYAPGHVRGAFEEWLEATELRKASLLDNTFTLWSGEVIQIPKLLNQLSRCSAMTGAWVIEQYRGCLIGEKAWRTYSNAVKVIRAIRRQQK